MFDIDNEWEFITHETLCRVSENKPCESMDLAIREILLSLQCLLASCHLNNTKEIVNKYAQTKQIYLTLIS